MAILAARDHEAAELLFCRQADERAQGKLDRARLDASRGQLDVFAAERVFDVGNRELSSGEQLPVDPHAHRVTAPPADGGSGDARDRRQTVEQIALGVVRDFHGIHGIGAEIQRHDRVGRRIRLQDLRRIRLFRQRRQHARDPIAHVVGGRSRGPD